MRRAPSEWSSQYGLKLRYGVREGGLNWSEEFRFHIKENVFPSVNGTRRKDIAGQQQEYLDYRQLRAERQAAGGNLFHVAVR